MNRVANGARCAFDRLRSFETAVVAIAAAGILVSASVASMARAEPADDVEASLDARRSDPPAIVVEGLTAAEGARDVLVSTWNAGFPPTTTWRRDHVFPVPGGQIGLRVSAAPEGAERPFYGGEFQSRGFRAVYGRVEWRAKLPIAPRGCVAAMFVYKYPYTAIGNREFDFEYVPEPGRADGAPGRMELNMHMRRDDGVGESERVGIPTPAPRACFDDYCGWAIEFQPNQIVYQRRDPDATAWTTIGRYVPGAGWDGDHEGTREFSSDEVWSEQRMNAFTSYWCTDERVGWLGRLNLEALRSGASIFVVDRIEMRSFRTLPVFDDADWELTPEGLVLVKRIPESDLDATDIEVRVADGDWTRLAPAVWGAYPIPDGAPSGAPISLRLVTRGPAFERSGYEVLADPSEPKNAP